MDRRSQGLERTGPAVSGTVIMRCYEHPVATLTATILGSSVAFIDGSVVNVALPAIAANFDTGATGTTWIRAHRTPGEKSRDAVECLFGWRVQNIVTNERAESVLFGRVDAWRYGVHSMSALVHAR